MVGATSSLETSPTRRVVSDVRVCMDPERPKIAERPPCDMTIGVTSSLTRSIAAVGAASTTMTRASRALSKRIDFSNSS